MDAVIKCFVKSKEYYALINGKLFMINNDWFYCIYEADKKMKKYRGIYFSAMPKRYKSLALCAYIQANRK